MRIRALKLFRVVSRRQNHQFNSEIDDIVTLYYSHLLDKKLSLAPHNYIYI